MKKIFLILLLSVFSLGSFAQNVLSLFNKANTFFDLFFENKLEEAHNYFSDEAKTKVSTENLKQLANLLESKLGKVKSIDAIQSKNQGDFFAVILNGVFENDTQDFVMLFDKSEKVVGLQLLPKAVTYQKPSYADTNVYVEKSTYIEFPNHQLATVITTPKNVKNFPVVVLVHGSGPNDMDETIGPNKPFKDIAAGLAAKGIATVRYVKRTLIYPNDFKGAFTVKEETTDDAILAIELAKKIPGADLKNIYVFGHSLGGMLAPKIATLAPDLKGIVIASAPARKLTNIIIDQNKYIFELSKDTSQAMKDEFKNAMTELEKTKITKLLPNMKPDSAIAGLPASYWIDLNNYDQLATAKKLNKQRIYILQGGNDFQITETDFNIWNNELNKKKNVTLKLYPELNHLLSVQTEKGTVMQYQKPANVSEQLIDDLANWIKAN